MENTLSDQGQQLRGKGFLLRFWDFVGKLVRDDLTQDGVFGVVQPFQQGLHRQFLRSLYGIAPTACLLVGGCGQVGTGLDEGGITGLLKTVLLKVFSQIEVVVRQLFPLLFRSCSCLFLDYSGKY